MSRQTAYAYKPKLFFALTFLITFVLWFAGAVLSFREGNHGEHMFLLLPGLMTPFLLSLLFIFRSGNRDLKRDFVHRLTSLRLINVKVLPAWLLVMPLAVSLSILLSLLVGESPAQFRLAEEFSFSSGFVPVFLLLLLAATFEELGWRGYAFDSLAKDRRFLSACILFGCLWSLWHVPLLVVKDSYQYELLRESPWFALNFFAGIVPMGVILSWVCIKNQGSVLVAIGFHLVINLSQEMFQMSQVTKSIETGVLVLFTLGLVWIERDLFWATPQQVREGAGV